MDPDGEQNQKIKKQGQEVNFLQRYILKISYPIFE